MNMLEKDQAIIDSLRNPDDIREQHFGHDFQISQKIIGTLICDRYFLVQCLDIIKPEYFEDECHKLICSIVFDFFRKYKALPNKAVIQNEIKERRKNSPQIYNMLGELEVVIADYVPGLNDREYLLEKIVAFAKEQQMKVSFFKSMDILKANKEPWSEIREELKKIFLVDKGHDVGLDYFNSMDERYDRMIKQMNNKAEIFSSGFPKGIGKGIDGLLSAGGLCRGEIGAYEGTSGAGKSIALINASTTNLLWGKKVLYISLEMNQDKIAQRFDSILSGEPSGTLIDNKQMVIDAIKQQVYHEEDKRRLIIKHYPGGSADVNTFRAYMSQLALYGFIPDLVIVDYVGEMKDMPGIKTYESRQLIVRDLRALAVEENVCVLTAFQANRGGKEAQETGGHIDDSNLADSFGQARPMDAIWAITKPEPACNFGFIHVVKHRDGITGTDIYYEMDTNTLKMCEIPLDIYKDKMNRHRKEKANKVDKRLEDKQYEVK